ncbi:MAG: hypothetical protein J2P37_17915, partial [Ktedonobacteraceae bacterium]|nr:hypothetical protein [Ktedonobacteraceae bacterium]
APTSPCWPESAVRASLAVEALGLIPSGNVERAVDPHLEGGRCTRDRCPDDYGDYAALCPTRFPHAPVPPWYTNAPYDPGRPKGPTHWQKFVRAVGLANAIKQRQAFIDGFVDTHGIWRCGHCYLRQRMMDLGAQLGYPDMHALYPLAETRGVAGYASWLAVNCSAGETLMQTVGRQAGAVVANLCRFFQTIALACRQRALHVAREAA